MRFIKFHGHGNDYIVCEAKALAEVGSLNEFVGRICDRHYGAGADGVAVLGDAENSNADFSVRIFNPDGSEAAMSGNGTRAAAAYLHYQSLWTEDDLRLQTQAGVKRYRLCERISEGRYRFAAEIGQPVFESVAIPMVTPEPLARILDYPLLVEGETVTVTALLMCNPNCCVFVESFSLVEWRRLGRAIETHRQFPERTNVEFVRVRDRGNIEVRVWERGVGETRSSGTGACAAAVAACVQGFTDRQVGVEMPGGRFGVEWRADGEVLLTGAAEVVYRGEWLGGW